jgi:hypothetical protein
MDTIFNKENPSEPCPLCGKDATNSIQGKRRRFRHCTSCDLIFVPPDAHPTPEEEVHRYRQHQNSADNPGYVSMLSAVLALIQRFGPATGRLLDYGCGPEPVFVNICRQAGYDAYGYDPYFYKEFPARKQFELITAIEVWEHFRSPASEIRYLQSLLMPGALMAVRTLLHNGEEDFASWWYAADNTHISFYSQRTVDWIAAYFKLKLIFSDGEKLLLFTPAC